MRTSPTTVESGPEILGPVDGCAWKMVWAIGTKTLSINFCIFFFFFLQCNAMQCKQTRTKPSPGRRRVIGGWVITISQPLKHTSKRLLPSLAAISIVPLAYRGVGYILSPSILLRTVSNKWQSMSSRDLCPGVALVRFAPPSMVSPPAGN